MGGACGSSNSTSVAGPEKASGIPKPTAPSASDPKLKSADLEEVRAALLSAFDSGTASPEAAEAEARLRAERRLPPDWDLRAYCGGRRLEGGLGGRQESTVIAYEEQGPAVEQAMQSLLDGTYRKVYTRDRRGAPIPDRFVIRKVHRVMNDQVWREYIEARDKARGNCAGAQPECPGGTQTMNLIETNGLTALPVLDRDVNEHWLFHGTTGAAATGIAENDFRLDLTGSNAGTLYGKGIYLAENSSKSDEYGEGPKGPAGEEAEMGFEAPRPPPGPPPPLVRESYILLCRSVLGRVHYTDNAKPDADELQKSCLDGQYESVLGDRVKIRGTFREIIVYSDDNVYPEYIIKYERIFFHEKFAQIYEQMLERRNRGHFQGPNEEELEVLRSLWNVYSMPNHGKINKWQLLDMLMAIYQPPSNEEADLDATFQQWDTKCDGKIDWDEFLQEMTIRVNDGVACSGPEKFAEVYRCMLQRQQEGQFDEPDEGEMAVLRMVWYQYTGNAASIDKRQLLELLKAVNQPPANETDDLDATFGEIDTKGDGVIDLEEFLQEIVQRVKDGVGC